MISFEGSLLLVQSDTVRITVTRFRDLARMHDGADTVIWTADRGTGHRSVWAPELHTVDGRWYVYYTAGDGRSHSPRTYVLEADHPLGPYRELGKVSDPCNDMWAIDLTVLRHRGALYAVWSGWDGPNDGFPQNLYIAPMANPWTLADCRTLISRPDHDWEMSVAAVNEGPSALWRRDGKLFIVYSADASWTTAYKMGLLEWVGGDLTDAASWRKVPRPIFTAGGHASFVETGNGLFAVYHRKSTSDPGWADREIHYAPVRWDAAGYPVIGRIGLDPYTAARVPGASDQAAAPVAGFSPNVSVA